MRTAFSNSSAKPPSPEPSTRATRGRKAVRPRMNCAVSSARRNSSASDSVEGGFGMLVSRPALSGRVGASVSLPYFFQVFLHLQRCHAAGPRGSDRLPIVTVGHVSGNKNPRDFGTDMPIRKNQVAFSIASKLIAYKICIRSMPDAEEHGAGGKIPLLASLQVAQPKSDDFLFADVVHVVNDGVGEELDLVVLASPVEHDPVSYTHLT